jgi:hypothetical protein
MTLVNIARVSTSLDGENPIRWFDLLPFVGCNIEPPKVAKLVIIIVSTSENPHTSLVDTCRVATSRFGSALRCINDLGPLIFLEKIFDDVISPLAEDEASENNHRILIIINDSGVLISWQWKLIRRYSRLRLDDFPLKGVHVKRKEFFIVSFEV